MTNCHVTLQEFEAIQRAKDERRARKGQKRYGQVASSTRRTEPEKPRWIKEKEAREESEKAARNFAAAPKPEEYGVRLKAGVLDRYFAREAVDAGIRRGSKVEGVATSD